MGSRRLVVPELDKLRRKLEKEPAPTTLTLFVDQDRLNSLPGRHAVTKHSLADRECSCEKALLRFKASNYSPSDGTFTLSVKCSTKAAMMRAFYVYNEIRRLGQPTQQNVKEPKTLRGLICEFAALCEHRKAMFRKPEPRPTFNPYPVIPRCRMDNEGVPILGSDLDSDGENDKPHQHIVPNGHALFAYNTVINDAFIEKLLQKLPRNRKDSTSENPGYIYILKSPQIPDYLKIGVTADDPAVRRKQWDRCYPEIQLHAHTSEIPNAKLVETLIHIELLAQRHTGHCSKCKGNKTHGRSRTERFRITEQLADQIIAPWARWMCSRPYQADTRTLSQTWVNRLEKVRGKGYRPGVDDLLFAGDTWSAFTDMRRTRGVLDESGAFKLTRCKDGKSPFSDQNKARTESF